VSEYFIVARSFAAPFVSDESTGFQEATTPVSALEKFARRYTHPCGLYAAECYASADAYHRRAKMLARWLSNHARVMLETPHTSFRSNGPGSVELDHRTITIDDPRGGRAEVVP
jgi:hypothetical protein